MPYFVYWIVTPQQRFPWIGRQHRPAGSVEIVPGYREEPAASFANYDLALAELSALRRAVGL